MSVKVNKDIVNKSIVRYGTQRQSIICMEECGELIQAISKKLRGYEAADDMILEELADVYVSLEMIRQCYFINEAKLQKMIDDKQFRQLHRILGD